MSLYNRKGNYAEKMFESMTVKDGSTYEAMVLGLVKVLKLYFPLAEEWNKWKMFSHPPLGPGPEGLYFESHAQCLSVAVLLSAIADVYFWAPVPTQPFIQVDNIHFVG